MLGVSLASIGVAVGVFSGLYAEEQCIFGQQRDKEPLGRDDYSGEWFELLYARNFMLVTGFGVNSEVVLLCVRNH